MGINDFRKRLASLHFWNALLVTLLALSGLVMFSGYWREILSEARAGIKWLHVIIGLVSIIPVIYYMPHITRHWKQLEGKAWQRFNVIVVLLLLISWETHSQRSRWSSEIDYSTNVCLQIS